MKKRTNVFWIGVWALISAAAPAQERPVVSEEKLVETLGHALGLAEEAAAARVRAGPEGSLQEFVRDASRLQRAFEPIIVLIAETNAPRAVQRFAMQVAIGAKEVELALWYFIFGALSNQAGYLQNGDQLLKRGLGQLEEARSTLRAE